MYSSSQSSPSRCLNLEFIGFNLYGYIYYLAYLQMAGDMEQQIPVISVPMPGKTNKTHR